ncbi:hypothetical protein [Chlorogloeopsis fritschii]|uniref:hypothetical protein n=1 Tax=Chlorogloeopsis fritschii TaxID=1124 RepID=UPI0023F37330|nr:hypothetical protein [Chlorogloeopsis fritschii]
MNHRGAENIERESWEGCDRAIFLHSTTFIIFFVGWAIAFKTTVQVLGLSELMFYY